MAIRALRHTLTLQIAASLLLALLFLVLLCIAWVPSQINREIESRQMQLARAVASQIQRYLDSGATSVRASAAIKADRELSLANLQRMLDAQLNSADTLTSIVKTDYRGRSSAVGVAKGQEAHRLDLLNLDFSFTPIFKKVAAQKKPLWSDTFMSTVTGSISVAYAVPGSDGISIGEINLGNVSSYLKQITTGSGEQIMILDQKGQVIADSENSYTGQQLNLSVIPLVRSAIAQRQPKFERFTLQNKNVFGSMLQMPSIDWFVLVTHSVESLYRPFAVVALVIAGGLTAALLTGVFLSISMARKMSKAFNCLILAARDIANGKVPDSFPQTAISEFNQLSDNLLDMSAILIQREHELKCSEVKYRQIVDNSPIAILRATVEGNIIQSNPALATMLGCATSMEMMEYVNGEGTIAGCWQSPEEFRALVERTTKARGSFILEEIHLNQKGGGRITGLCSVQLANDPSTGEPCIMAFIDDVSEKKRLEEQLHQSQKMESVGRLAGGVAHDFNNMLGVILTSTEMAKRKAGSNSGADKYLEMIKSAAQRSAAITRQLLAFSRKEIISPRTINLNEQLMDSHKLLERLVTEDIRLTFQPAATLWNINADPAQLDQILMNLIVNARDALPDGGVVMVKTDNISVGSTSNQFGATASPGNYVRLSVSDTGCGMDAVTKSHIFEPFFTTKQSGRGTGLGLSTVYGIVTQNGGFIDVWSEPGQGTVFNIYFPKLESEEDLPEQDTPRTLLTGSGSILLVEDEEMLLSTIADILEDSGYHVIQALRPEQAIAICSDMEKNIDIVLTDVVMPDMNGREMAEKILQIRPDVKVVYMSGYHGDIVASRGIIEQGMHYIQKPLDYEDLKHMLNELLVSR